MICDLCGRSLPRDRAATLEAVRGLHRFVWRGHVGCMEAFQLSLTHGMGFDEAEDLAWHEWHGSGR